jgi:hypothetical protein
MPIPLDSPHEALADSLSSATRHGVDLRKRRSGPSSAVIPSLFVANAIAWCRWLNAFPGEDFEMAERPPGYVGWIEVEGRGFIFSDETGRGRFGHALPPSVEPASVPRVSVDSDARPGRRKLQTAIDSIQLALAHGWTDGNAEPALELGQRVSGDETRRAYGERYQYLCQSAAQALLEGLNVDYYSELDEATLAEVVSRADALVDALARDAAEAYAEFRTDAVTCANACLAHDIWLALHGAEEPQLSQLVEALASGATKDDPEEAASEVTGRLVMLSFWRLSEGELDHLLGRIEEVAEKVRSDALAIAVPDHTTYFDALYLAAARTHEWDILARRIDDWKRPGWSDEFVHRVERSCRLAEECRVRLSVAMHRDALDVLGIDYATARDRVQQIRARDGDPAARLAALEETIHTLSFPRSLEPYLRGEVDVVAWKERLGP